MAPSLPQPRTVAADPPPPWVGRLPAYAGGVALVACVLLLVGWQLHFPVLHGLLPGIAPGVLTMKANSCLGGAFAGLSLCGRRGPWRWAALVPVVVGVTAVVEWSTHRCLHIDQLLAQDPGGGSNAGRPSPQIAGALLLFGLARLATDLRGDRLLRLAGGLTAAYGSTVLMLQLGWLFQAPELTSAGGRAGVSGPSALVIGVLAIGLLALQASHRPLSYLWNRGLTGTVVRRLLPAIIVVPPVLGSLRLLGQRSGLYGLNLGISLFAGTMIVVLAGVVTVTAASIHTIETERSRLNRELQAIFDSVPAALTMRDPRGRLLRYNRPPSVEDGGDGVYFRPPIRDDDALLPSEVAALEAGRPLTHMHTPTGSDREYQVTKFPVYDADGSVLGIGGFALDVTTRATAQRAAEEASERLRAYLDSAPDATVVADEHGVIRYANHQVTDLLGYDPEELIGQKVEVLVPAAFREHHVTLRTGFAHAPARRAMGSGHDLAARHRDGHTIPVEVSLGPVATSEGAWVAAAVRDVTARRETEAALREAEQLARHLADHDPLTGIWNRRRFEGELEAILAEIGTVRAAAGGLAIVDVDHFKAVNDTAGHHAGDRLLVAVAAALSRVVRDDGAVSRLGGDEFAVVWCGDHVGADERGRQLVSAVAEAAATCGLPDGLGVGASVGLASFADLPADERTTGAVLVRADDALYAAKDRGRGRAVVYAAALARTS